MRDYAAFLRERWRFIAAGTALAVAVMAIVTLSLPRAFIGWAVVDTGTLGARTGFGAFVNQFNAGGYRDQLDGPAAAAVRRVRIIDGQSKLLIRVEATDGATASLAVKRLADFTVRQLGAVPMPPDHAPATVDEIADVEPVLRRWRTRVDETIAQERGRAAALRATERDIVAALRARSDDRRLVGELSQTLELQTQSDDRLRTLEACRASLESMRDATLSRGVVAMLRADADTASTRSVDQILTRTAELDARVAADRGTGIVVPVRIAELSSERTSPDWPNLPLNLLIAAIFGIVGSTFAAVVLPRAAGEEVRV